MRISSKARVGTHSSSSPDLSGSAGMSSTQLARPNTVLDIPHTKRLGPIGENRPADPDAAGMGNRGMDGVTSEGQRMLKPRPKDARKTQMFAGYSEKYISDEPFTPRVNRHSPRGSLNSKASTESRTTASSHQSSGRRSSPRQSRDGGSNAGFSYLSASSRSERRLLDSLPRRATAGMSRSSGSCASGASTERSYREGSRKSLASSASERHLSECRSPRQHRLESPRSSYSGNHSTYSTSSARNRSPSPRIGQMWDFFGGSEPSNL